MGNLGAYQVITTLAKKVGGPVQLVAGIAVGGYMVIRLGEAGIKKGVKNLKNHSKKNTKENSDKAAIFIVKENKKYNEVLEFRVGDKFRVLESDGEAILIEIMGADDNPHFVSANFLRSISDFK